MTEVGYVHNRKEDLVCFSSASMTRTQRPNLSFGVIFMSNASALLGER